MSSTICSGGKVAVVKSKGGIEVTTYDNELDAVLGMLNHGSLGGGFVYGCEEHVSALAIAATKIEEVRRQIEAEAEAELARDAAP